MHQIIHLKGCSEHLFHVHVKHYDSPPVKPYCLSVAYHWQTINICLDVKGPFYNAVQGYFLGVGRKTRSCLAFVLAQCNKWKHWKGINLVGRRLLWNILGRRW